MAPARLTLALALLLAWKAAYCHPDKLRRQDVMHEGSDEDSFNFGQEATTNERIEIPHHRHHHQTQDSYSRSHTDLDRSRPSSGSHHHEGIRYHRERNTHHHSRQKSQWNQGAQDVKKANDNYLRIRSHAICKQPRPKVIRVKDVYPDTSKEYFPTCTILHRCGDDAGCCEHDTLQCVAKTVQSVELYFYTIRMNPESGSKDIPFSNNVERISFVNHTECECQIINDDRPRLGSSGASYSSCLKCPLEFSIRVYSNGICSCDCFDRQRSCLPLKKGRGTLNDEDRRCIDSGRCNPPECEFGLYDVNLGRCPRKNEKRSSPHHYRWTVDERD